MRDDNHKQKMIMPVIITVVFLLYLIVYCFVIVMAAQWKPLLLLFAIPLIALGAGMIVTLKSRIDEIRSGEEDDLDNY